jgi:hypothetical protein
MNNLHVRGKFFHAARSAASGNNLDGYGNAVIAREETERSRVSSLQANGFCVFRSGRAELPGIACRDRCSRSRTFNANFFARGGKFALTERKERCRRVRGSFNKSRSKTKGHAEEISG